MAKIGRPVERRARPHKGVKVKRLNRTGTWVARWRDPDTGAEVQQSFKPLGITTEEGRRAWATDKANALTKRRKEISEGHPKRTATTFRRALDDYYAAKSPQIKPVSMAAIRLALEPLVSWAAGAGINYIENLTPAQLKEFYTVYINRPAYGSVKGPERDRKAEEARRAADPKAKSRLRGKKTTTTRTRAKRTINKALILLRSFFNDARAIGRTPLLTPDNINHRTYGLLKLIRGKVKGEIEFLHPHDVQRLLEACLEHDAAKFTITRDEHDGKAKPGTTPRHEPIAPFALTCLLSGMRFSEAAGLRWREVNFKAHEIALPAERTKTNEARKIDFSVTPGLERLLSEMEKSAINEYVFGPMTRDRADTARERLKRDHDAPKFGWHTLRRTCGTALTCAPSIFGAASAYMSARRLGHSVVVAQESYLGQIKHLPADAKTLEAALEIESHVNRIITAQARRTPHNRAKQDYAASGTTPAKLGHFGRVG